MPTYDVETIDRTSGETNRIQIDAADTDELAGKVAAMGCMMGQHRVARKQADPVPTDSKKSVAEFWRVVIAGGFIASCIALGGLLFYKNPGEGVGAAGAVLAMVVAVGLVVLSILAVLMPYFVYCCARDLAAIRRSLESRKSA